MLALLVNPHLQKSSQRKLGIKLIACEFEKRLTMWFIIKTLRISLFTFGSYVVDTKHSTVTFTYHVKFAFGMTWTFTDRLILSDVTEEMWQKVPKDVLEPTLQALLIMIGINYWQAFPTRNICIEGFALTREQAQFWNHLYLYGLGEFFYLTKIDFRNLIAFPYDPSATAPIPAQFERPKCALLLNGAGKDSILSAEILKASGTPFDFFAFAPTPAHTRTAKLVGTKTVNVHRRRDPWLNVIMQGTYPSVSTFTFIAVLLAETIGYEKIVFSNERSADFGNLEYLGLPINHQWCKSSEAEKMINEYIQRYITPSISTTSLLRQYSELEIVKRFVSYPQYLHDVTSCNGYFWLPRIQQRFMRTNYWCNQCPKCVFLFASFSAFLPEKEVLSIFGANLYTKRHHLKLFRRLLGIEGFKPLDCVGEPEEMILAMHYAAKKNEYTGTPAMKLFEKYFPSNHDFDEIEKRVFTE